MKTVYDEWSPLKKVLVGSTFKIEDIDEESKRKLLFAYEEDLEHRHKKFGVFKDNQQHAFRIRHIKNTIQSLFDIFDAPTIDSLKKIHDETNEDTDALAKICEAYGAEVVRPKLQYGIESLLEHPLQCRDVFGKVGNTIIEAFAASPNRRFENFHYRDVMLDEFKEGSRVISMPYPMYEYADHIDKKYEHQEDLLTNNTMAHKEIVHLDDQRQIIGDTAGIYKCGKHIFHTHANPQQKLDIVEHSRMCITTNGIEWYRREFPQHEFVSLNAYGHVDGKFAILRPGLVLTWAERYVPQIMKDHNWDIILMEESANFDGKTIKELCEERGLNKKYPLEHLFGLSQETRFDCNVLSLDENTIITSGYDKNLADKLKKYNIEMIPWVNRWNVLFSGGAHCCSVDLEREGKLVDYFS